MRSYFRNRATFPLGLLATLSCGCLLLGQDLGTLSMESAIRTALSVNGSAQVAMGEEAVSQALSRKDLARSALLPHLSGTIQERRATVNLEAMGIRFRGILPIPSKVGPFNTFDARATLQQRIVDLGSLGRLRAAGKGVEAAERELENVKDGVAAAVAVAYLEVSRARASVESADAAVALAEELADLARSMKSAGTGTRVEVTRAEVQLADQQQRRLLAANELEKARLRMLRVMGLDLATRFEVEQMAESADSAFPEVENLLTVALRSRADYQVQKGLEESARLNFQAVRAERYPTLSGFADYGSIGPTPGDAIPTWTMGLAIEIPVFDGGAVDARRGEAASRYRAEQLKTSELARQIELEVRTALHDLSVAREQVAVAGGGLDLARQELEQARRRYASGVATSLEVTDAQSRLKRAEENRISALFQYNLARISVADATGMLRNGMGL